MSRPIRCRRVCCRPISVHFKPGGVPRRLMEEVNLELDELEALRLGDLEGMYQEDAARKMNVSRQTFGNIATSAHRKVADALVNAKALRIEGGVVRMMERQFLCSECKTGWSVAYGSPRPSECPKCKSSNIHRAPQDRGWARGCHGLGQRRCGRMV